MPLLDAEEESDQEVRVPNLDRIWETFIPLRPNDRGIPTLKGLVIPWLMEEYRADRIVWFCFLFHDKASGVIPADAPHDVYIHVRVELAEAEGDALPVPWYAQMTRKVDARELQNIAGVDLRSIDGGAARAWWIIGRQSKVVAEILHHHAVIEPEEWAQFHHYFENMMMVPKAQAQPKPKPKTVFSWPFGRLPR